MVPPPPGPSRDAATPPAAGRLSGRLPAVRPATVPGAAVRPLTATASDWPGPSGSAPGGSARIPVFVTNPVAPRRRQPYSGLSIMLLAKRHPSRTRSPTPRHRP